MGKIYSKGFNYFYKYLNLQGTFIKNGIRSIIKEDQDLQKGYIDILHLSDTDHSIQCQGNIYPSPGYK